MIRRPAANALATALGALIFVSSAAPAVTLNELQRDIDDGDFARAAIQSESYLADHPGNRDARFLHARALAGQGDDKQAIAAFESLAQDFPLRVEPANNLAVLYAAQGDYDKARRWLDKALATQPAYATAHRNLGNVYTALADLAYRRALGNDNADTRVPLTMLDRIYYAQESVAPGNAVSAVPAPPEPAAADASVEADSETGSAEPTTSAATPATSPDQEKQKPAEPAPPPADNTRSIIQTVRAWALAWSSQDFDAYTDFYADDFDPGDRMNRAQWLALRRARLDKPDNIHIRIEDPAITRISDNRARVDFVQRYESPRYSDKVDKRLLLERNRDGWRILRESSVAD